jgi:hypothetical protein
MHERVKEKITLREMVILLIAQKDEDRKFRSAKLREIGFVGRDDELAKLFEFGVAKFCKMSKLFENEYQRLLENYRTKSNEHIDMCCSFSRSPSRLSGY